MDLGPIFTIDTSSTIPVYFLQSTITFHTIHLTLCFQKTGEIGNLTVRWGKVLSLCCACFQVASNTFDSFPSSYWFDNLGFLLREELVVVLIIPSYWGIPTKLYSDLRRIKDVDKVSMKILCYLPFIKRIQRLYMTKESATEMTWHKTGRDTRMSMD